MNANYRGMNQYPDEYSGYGQSGNNMQPVGYHQGNYENANMVQVPLKNRHAPYQIPRSPQNYYPDKGAGQQQSIGSQGPQQAMHTSQTMIGQQAVGGGQIQTKTSQPQGQIAQTSGMCQSPAMMYAGSSPHSQLQQNSPSSPLMMPSPAAAHQSQGLSSPGALHSPSSAAVCSPVPSSPGLASMRSPSSMPMRSPAHMSSGYPSQPISSPPQRPLAASDSSGGTHHCSPTSMHSPASHSSSPYAPAGMAHLVSSPPHSQSFSSPTQCPYNKMNMLMDSGQGPGGQRAPGMHSHGSDPLQSLQKLVMLPETQVVDPKSVVSDGCLQNCEDGSKNCEGPAEQSREAMDCSAGVKFIISTPPITEVLSTVHASPQEMSAESVPAAQELESKLNSTNAVHDTEASSVTETSTTSVNENVCVTPVSQSPSDLQTSISDTSDPITQSTSSQIKSCKSDALRDTVVSDLINTETCQSETEVSGTTESERSESAVESTDQSVSTSCSEKQSVSSPMLCNGPVTQEELSDKVYELQSSSENKTSGAKDEVESDNQKVLTEVVPDTAEEVVKEVQDHTQELVKNACKGVQDHTQELVKNTCKGVQDHTQELVKNACTMKTMLKPSPPKKRHSQRLLSLTGKSIVTSSMFSDKKSTAYSDLESQNNTDKIVLQLSESVKPSPPKKRHSRRHSQSTSSLESAVTDLCAGKMTAVIDDENNASVKCGFQGSDTAGKGKLVNGFDKHGNQVESCDAVVEGKLQPKNHIQKKSPRKQQINNCSEAHEKTPEVSLVAKEKAKDMVRTDYLSLTKTVNGPEDRAPLKSDVIVAGESDTKSTVQLQGSSIMSDTSEIPNVGIGNSIGNTNIMTDNCPVSDDDNDSLSSEVDFGYDSPPCVDEADGNADCVENDSDKKPNQSDQDTKSSPSKAIPFVATRSVTRSITGRAPKRKFDETYYTTFNKRTRRSSYITDQNMMSLSMECEEIDMKESVSDVEVISSGDESHILKETDGKRNPIPYVAVTDNKFRKSPVVVLNKASSGNNKKDKRYRKNQNSQITSPKSRKHTPNFYSVRGAGGRFISRREAGISSKPVSVSQNIDSNNEPLNVVDTLNTSSQNTDSENQPFSVVVNQDTKDEVSGTSCTQNTMSVIKKNYRNTLEQHSVKPVTNTSHETAYASDRAAHSRVAIPIKPPQIPHPKASPSVKETSQPHSSSSDKKGAQKNEVRPVSKKKTKKHVKGKSNKKQFEELDSVDDSFKNMKLSRTLHHLQNNKKDKSQSVGPFSPFIRVHGDHSAPSAVSVFNVPPSSKGAAGTVAAMTAIQATNFFSDKSVMLPWTKTNKSTWICALCGKRSSYRFLGDLFGPYFMECHIPALKKLATESSKKDGKQDTGASEVQNPHNTRRRSLSLCQNPTSSVEELTNSLQEVWVHEDCAMWSSGVYVVGSRVFGLEEALKATDHTVCACCQEKGALIGCLHKGCGQTFHYMCAVDQECFLDVENFSMLCPRHKDKRMKTSSASPSKS